MESVAKKPRLRVIDARVLLSLLVLLGYLAVARASGNLYPFSTFPMYSRSGDGGASRVLARASDGSLHDVTNLVEWDCPATIDWATAECDVRGIGYLERDFARHVATQRGTGSEDVELLRRQYEFAADGTLRTRDCSIARCRATRP